MRRQIIMTLLLLGVLPSFSGCVETQQAPPLAPSTAQPSRAESETASRELREAAEAGQADAQNQLGIHYSVGLKNYTQAKRWFDKAAEQGHPGAQVNLGTLYLLGNGAPQSDQMALSWFRRAANQKDALAFAKLGLMYALGRGVPQDYVKAHMWYNLSAAHGEKRSAEFRDTLARKMTPAQLAEAQRLASEWRPKNK